ncbi:MAG: helix-turn-helix domain-containing protein [Bacillota bacterium]
MHRGSVGAIVPARWRWSSAAALLGISVQNLYRKIDAYRLAP